MNNSKFSKMGSQKYNLMLKLRKFQNTKNIVFANDLIILQLNEASDNRVCTVVALL